MLLGGVATSQNIYLTIACLMGVGLAGTTFATTANTTIQLAAPDEMRGRVVSLYMLLFAGSTPIGGLILGLLADGLGTQWAIAIFAALCGVGTAAGAIYYFGNKGAVEGTRRSHAPDRRTHRLAAAARTFARRGNRPAAGTRCTAAAARGRDAARA